MILVTGFMDEAAVAALSAAHPTTCSPHLADNQSEIPALMSGMQALVVRNRTTVNEALLREAPDLRLAGRLGGLSRQCRPCGLRNTRHRGGSSDRGQHSSGRRVCRDE